MTAAGRLLFVVGCIVCLVVVASALPAADPRLDAPGDRNGAATAGEWDAIDATPDFSTTTGEFDDDEGDETDVDHDIEISGAIEPGNDVTVSTGHFGPFTGSQTIEVNGERAGQTDDFGRTDVEVPYAEEMTVTIRGEDTSRTVDVETNATIDSHDSAIPGGEFDLSAHVGSTPVEDAVVSVDGEAVTETDEDGSATVTLPEEARATDLHVERGPVEGTHTVEVAEPEVTFVSPLLFPGSPTPVQVSADGTSVPDATVSIDDGDGATTNDDGRATVWLPIDDEATVTAEVGAETATTTVENLYLRLGVVAVLVPGFVLGGVVTYLRLAAIRDRRRAGNLADLFVVFGTLLEGLSRALTTIPTHLSAAVSAIGGAVEPLRSVRLPSLSGLSVPRLRLPGGAWTVPSLGSLLSAVGTPLVSLPSRGSWDRERWSPPSRPTLGWFSADDDDDASHGDAGDDTPALADRPLEPRRPRAEIRAAWHAFLDRLEVTRRETWTPGQIARYARSAGYPASRVSRLVSVFRDVEYGDRPPSPERASTARETTSDLLEHEPDDTSEGEQ